MVAAPALAASVDTNTPDALVALPFIANGALSEPLVWRFTKGDFESRTVQMRQTIAINITPAVLAAALAAEDYPCCRTSWLLDT